MIVATTQCLPATRRARGIANYFLFKAWISTTNLSISFAVSLPENLGMRHLPLVMMLRKSSADAAATLGELRDGPAKCRPSADLPWHLAQFFWNAASAARPSSAGGAAVRVAARAKKIKQGAMASFQVFKFDLIDVDLT